MNVKYMHENKEKFI